MVFDDMIKTESSDLMREHWENYRNTLTEYVICSFFHEKEYKPSLAIFGAGGMNDMELCELVQHFQVVLIDRDVDLIKRTAARYLENPEDVICVDLKFWDVSDDEYRMFEALLQDGEEYAIIEDFLLDLADSMCEFDASKLPRFDYSVCIGVASQLNVRFLELANAYNRLEELEGVIKKLNELAVARMMKAVGDMTKDRIIYGYEAESYLDEDIPLMHLARYAQNVAWLTEESYLFPLGDGPCDIAGNDVLELRIIEDLAKQRYSLRNYMEALWPFSPKKEYKMLFLVLENN